MPLVCAWERDGDAATAGVEGGAAMAATGAEVGVFHAAVAEADAESLSPFTSPLCSSSESSCRRGEAGEGSEAGGEAGSDGEGAAAPNAGDAALGIGLAGRCPGLELCCRSNAGAGDGDPIRFGGLTVCVRDSLGGGGASLLSRPETLVRRLKAGREGEVRPRCSCGGEGAAGMGWFSSACAAAKLSAAGS